MFEQLMNIVKEYGQQAVVNNNAVPNEHNDAVMQEAGSSIMDGLKKMVQGGNLSGITQMLQGNGGNDVVSSLSNGFAGNIAQKFGIDATAASSVASGLIPKVLSSLTNKANDPNDSSIDVSGILNSLGGGSAAGMLSGIGSKLGLDKDGDGDVDMGDITKMFGK